MKCKQCEELRALIQEIFDATGYMDLYGNDIRMKAMVAKQGIERDQKVLQMYREAGQEAVKTLDIIIQPGATNGVFT